MFLQKTLPCPTPQKDRKSKHKSIGTNHLRNPDAYQQPDFHGTVSAIQKLQTFHTLGKPWTCTTLHLVYGQKKFISAILVSLVQPSGKG